MRIEHQGRTAVLLVFFSACIYLGAATTHYVTTNNLATQQDPYTNWAMAGTSIIDVVNTAMTNGSGNTVMVSNGNYRMTNQIVVTNPLTIQGFKGQTLTILDGNFPACTNQCIFFSDLATNSVFNGFTVSNFVAVDMTGIVAGVSGVTIRDCLITSNRSLYSTMAGHGGGISLGQDSLISNCTIRGNYATNYGGGCYGYAGGLTIVRCEISLNKSDSASSYGGGVAVEGNNNLIKDCRIFGNLSRLGGGVYIGSGTNNTLVTCTITGNVTCTAPAMGGGIYCVGTAVVSSCTSMWNVASNIGGGFWGQDSLLRNCLIAGNRAVTNRGGGVYGTNCTVESCTIVSNYAAVAGGGLYLDYVGGGTNNIIYYNTSAGGVANYTNPAGANVGLDHCCVTSAVAGDGNIEVNPQFMNKDTWDWRLVDSSPCIDAGTNRDWMTNGLDLRNWPRIFINIVDMGAYEARSNHLYYVATNGESVFPYITWVGAATTIQSAVDVALNDGDTVSVSNGVYVLTNQIVVQNAIILQSTNGPSSTIINGNGVTRCLWMSNSSALVSGFLITNGYNINDGYGGGVFLRKGVISNCWIAGNILSNLNAAATAIGGGGIYVYLGNWVKACRIYGNRFLDNATSARDNGGGGVFIYQNGWMTNCVIMENTWRGEGASGSEGGGGGVYIVSGGSAPPNLGNCQIVSNLAYAKWGAANTGGGGIYLTFGGSVQDSIISGNTNNSGGGGVTINLGGEIRNCLICSNKSGGAGAVTAIGQVTIQSCTIVENRGGSAGPAVRFEEGPSSSYRPLKLVNTIIYSNYAAGVVSNWSIVSDTANICLTNNCTYPTNFPANNIVSGCISNDPQFVDCVAGNYRLSANSPCINKGTNQSWMTRTSVDMAGNLRLRFGRVDMGAYEWYPRIKINGVPYERIRFVNGLEPRRINGVP